MWPFKKSGIEDTGLDVRLRTLEHKVHELNGLLLGLAMDVDTIRNKVLRKIQYKSETDVTGKRPQSLNSNTSSKRLPFFGREDKEDGYDSSE